MADTVKYKYEVRQIEAWADGEDGWNWNQSWHMGFFYTSSENVGKALTHYLKTQKGITFKRNRTVFFHEFPYTEILDRKDKEPLFAAIWTEEE